MRRPRPLTPAERHHLATEARALADELEAPYAPAVQRTISDTMDDAYPSKASGAGQRSSSGRAELTVVEAKATGRDRAAVEAERIANHQRHLLTTIPIVVTALRGARPDRPTEEWPCGHLKIGDNRRSKRCLECGAGPTRPVCENCDREVTAGGKRRRSVAYDRPGHLEGVELMECDRCWKYRSRHGLSWVGPAADVLALREGLVEAGGAFSV